MKLSFAKFISFTPREKLKSDPILSQILYRPLSFCIGYVLLRIGVKANYISIFATFLVLPICVLICIGWVNLALVLAIIFSIADCVDGNLARFERKTLVEPIGVNGAWLDACSGYVFYAFFPISIGFYCETQSDLFGIEGIIQCVSSLVAVTNILLRLMHQKLLNVQHNVYQTKKHSRNKYILQFKGEVGFLGFMLPFCYISFYMEILEFFLIFYLLIYSFGLIKFYIANIGSQI